MYLNVIFINGAVESILFIALVVFILYIYTRIMLLEKMCLLYFIISMFLIILLL